MEVCVSKRTNIQDKKRRTLRRGREFSREDELEAERKRQRDREEAERKRQEDNKQTKEYWLFSLK